MHSSIADQHLTEETPFLWLNPHWLPMRSIPSIGQFSLDTIRDADRKLHRFAPLLTKLFPDLEISRGIIESPLTPADKLQKEIMGENGPNGRWLIKGDHTLPIAGSIKARGGIYEVLLHAENLALEHGLMTAQDDSAVLASNAARALFSRHQVAVGSTGNLGLSIGIMAAALGFQATVHMSSNAKAWKKQRLRARGVEVVEHQGDFGTAVAAGRNQTAQSPRGYFVDDENSAHLFIGYSVAALRLEQQLIAGGIRVDAKHPLFVYLPCGVGGAPGGITFGLRHVFGDHVHCFFAEPVRSPAMLVRLASPEDRAVSVSEFGLDNDTEADGLAVGQASELAAQLIGPLVSGVFTVPDTDLFEDLYRLERSEGLRIEPSAAAGFRGPLWILKSQEGRRYLSEHGIDRSGLEGATHILWTTGGVFVPGEEYRIFHERGRLIASYAED